MQHLDEGTIHAWIDGELTPEQASELEAHVKDCATCAAMVAEARGLVAASTRILTALDQVPGGVLPSVPDIASAPVQAARRRWYQRTDVRAAAALLFVAGTSLVVVQSRDLRSKSAMMATADKAPAAAASAIATETAGAEAAGRAEPGMADAANVSPLATAPAVGEGAVSSEAQPQKTSARPVSPRAPEQRFGATAGARNQSLQQKVMADDRVSAGVTRDESQLSKEEASKRRAADAANLPAPPAAPAVPPIARIGAATPAATAPQVGVRSAPTALEATVVTGVESTPATGPLRMVRSDSTSGAKRTVYEVSRGVEVTLTESQAEAESDFAAKDVARQNAAAPERAKAAREAQVQSGRVAGAVADARPAPPSAPVPPPISSISWIDRGKRYTLTGRLNVKDLEAIKARLMQARR